MIDAKPGDVFVQDAGDGYKSIRIATRDERSVNELAMIEASMRPDGTVYTLTVTNYFNLHSEWPTVKLDAPQFEEKPQGYEAGPQFGAEDAAA